MIINAVMKYIHTDSRQQAIVAFNPVVHASILILAAAITLKRKIRQGAEG
jgi:hypothetical protein